MLFNSLGFAIFLPIMFFIYWLIPNKHRYIVLFIGSYYFYMSWNVKYVLLILFTTIVSYSCALVMQRYKNRGRKLVITASAVVASLLVLFFFKYFNFTQITFMRIMQAFAINLQPMTIKLLLPVGISFYTFQTLSYVIDVYKGEVKPQKNFIKYATFVAFFPQLVAGPIERTKNLMPQIDGEHTFSYKNASYGIKLMAWGFFKKLVLADNLAVIVNLTFDNLEEMNGFALVIALFAFTIQIYCDFSGYSDIAIGCAKLFDVQLMQNFHSPYYSISIKEFWRRWHISLSSWFRDYVYIPLGGNRTSKFRQMINVMVTFTLSGLWHGAAFTYIIWGALHGFMQCVENLIQKQSTVVKFTVKKGTILWWIKVIVVFMLVAAAWCFFRAGSVTQAIYVFRHMLDGIRNPYHYIKQGVFAFDLILIKQIIFPVILLAVFDYVALEKDPLLMIGKMKKIPRYAIYMLFFGMVLLLASFNSQEFVYFQF